MTYESKKKLRRLRSWVFFFQGLVHVCMGVVFLISKGFWFFSWRSLGC